VSADETRFDLTVIGSGPGGYVAAIRAAQLGLKTAVVEMAPALGGTCLHWGCIPTKALLHAAEVLDTTKHAGKFGVKVAPGEIDLPALHQYKAKVVTSNAKGIEYLFKKHRISVVPGRGRLRGRGKVEVTPKGGAPKILESKHVVLATGSAVRGLPGIDFDGERVISSDHALGLTRIPRSLIVLGAGAVGVEFASIYASFGSKVTIVELLPRLLPIEDATLGAELEKQFARRGIAVHTATRVEKVDRDEKGVRVHATRADAKIDLEAEVLLVAVGRRPMTDDIGLPGTQIRVDKGFVEVDAMMRTGEDGVYAIGDIVKTQALAHVASHEGIVAVEHAAGRPTQAVDYDKVPSCTYCSP
jgi:dihydrolipoamide dehydrogenase